MPIAHRTHIEHTSSMKGATFHQRVFVDEDIFEMLIRNQEINNHHESLGCLCRTETESVFITYLPSSCLAGAPLSSQRSIKSCVKHTL
mmetsp:Transcript_38896/g.57173  ORF Transcript_38896/g.57173 Transcript_38896/m.57173 type:complete len:88 (+) Transcript_38896:127-390(+)